MSLISDAGLPGDLLRILCLPAQALTCEKQDAHDLHPGLVEPWNPGRNRAWRLAPERTCILIKAA